jgi:outer membrane protein assembly factor BamE
VRSTLNTDRRLPLTRFALLLLATFCVSACVFRMDVQQGNLLDVEDVTKVEVGMTRKQVQFLLGTPMISDTFHRDRWDYAYYLVHGRSDDVVRRWLVVYFDGDRVTRFERDVEMQPAS